MSKRSHGPDLGLGDEMQETENHHSIHAGLEQKADDVALHEHASAHPGQSSATSTPFVQNRERWVRMSKNQVLRWWRGIRTRLLLCCLLRARCSEREGATRLKEESGNFVKERKNPSALFDLKAPRY